jgi:hypothetical protein
VHFVLHLGMQFQKATLKEMTAALKWTSILYWYFYLVAIYVWFTDCSSYPDLTPIV